MRACVNGHEVDEGAKFCAKCGSPAVAGEVSSKKRPVVAAAAGVVGLVVGVATGAVLFGGTEADDAPHDAEEAAQEYVEAWAEVLYPGSELVSGIDDDIARACEIIGAGASPSASIDRGEADGSLSGGRADWLRTVALRTSDVASALCIEQISDPTD